MRHVQAPKQYLDIFNGIIFHTNLIRNACSMKNERLSKTLQWFSGLWACVKALILESDQSWYLVLDESSLSKDRRDRNALRMQKLSKRNSSARQYENEISKSSGPLSASEAWKRVNPISMIKFLIYSLSDVI